MTILILNRSNLATTPYLAWLGEGDEAVLLTSVGAISLDEQTAKEELSGYRHVVTFEAFDGNPSVEIQALELHRQYGFDSVIAMNEFDLLRAARLRAAMGLPGQQPHQAEAYRDKLRMKELLTAAGIPVAPFAAVPHASDLHTFAATHGYPIVVKPRRGAGSMGVEVLGSAQELVAYVERTPDLGGDDGAPLLAEKFVEHDLFHIDGLIVAGELVLNWPSACGSCLSYRDGSTMISAMLDPGDPLTEALQNLTLRTIEALSATEVMAFHAEAFLTPNGDLLLNEIGSRVGGGKIYETIRLAFDVDMVREFVRASGSASASLPASPRPVRSAGFAIFPGRPGTLTAAPQACPVVGVDQYKLNVPVGTVLGQAEHSSARIASVVVAGGNRNEVEDTLTKAATWFAEASAIEPAPTHTGS